MEDPAPETFKEIVETDATFVGGTFDKRLQRAKYGKQPVFGMVQRGTDNTPRSASDHQIPSGIF